MIQMGTRGCFIQIFLTLQVSLIVVNDPLVKSPGTPFIIIFIQQFFKLNPQRGNFPKAFSIFFFLSFHWNQIIYMRIKKGGKKNEKHSMRESHQKIMRFKSHYTKNIDDNKKKENEKRQSMKSIQKENAKHQKMIFSTWPSDRKLKSTKKSFVGSHEHTHCTHVILLTLWGLKCFKDFIRDYNLILIATSNANFHKKNFRLPKLLISFDLLLIYSFSL